MDGVKNGDRVVSIHAWEVEDVDEVAPKLSAEMRALLSEMSKLLMNHTEQVSAVIRSHESKILRAIEDVKVPSVERASCQKKGMFVEKPAWSDVSVVPLPSCTDNAMLSLPVEEAPELQPVSDEEQRNSTFSVDTLAKQDLLNGSFAQKNSAKEQLPEYMRGRTSMLQMWRKTRRTRVSMHVFENSRIFSQTGVRKLLQSKLAELVVTLVIFLNSLIIGLEADWSIKHTNEDTRQEFQILNASFTAIFTLELMLRLFAYRKMFFSWSSREFSWNLFDLFLVVSGICDQALALLISTPNFTVIRVLRVMRFVRLIRVFRVLRFFQDLRIIIAGIAGAVKSMLWAVGLLFMMMYLMSICLLQLTSIEMEKMNSVGRKNLLTHYGSLITAIYTLYQSITGGLDWNEAAAPLLEISPALALLFCFYIAFSVLCVLNIITGVFVDNARNVCTADEEQLVIEGFENRVKWFEEVKKLFEKMVGGTGAGALDSDHFIMFLDDVKVQACFRRLGIDVHETSKNGLFRLLDFNETGFVDLEEFALGMQSLQGSAKAIDLARIHCELKKLKRDVQQLSHSLRGSATAFGGSTRGSTMYGDDPTASHQAGTSNALSSHKLQWFRAHTKDVHA